MNMVILVRIFIGMAIGAIYYFIHSLIKKPKNLFLRRLLWMGFLWSILEIGYVAITMCAPKVNITRFLTTAEVHNYLMLALLIGRTVFVLLCLYYLIRFVISLLTHKIPEEHVKNKKSFRSFLGAWASVNTFIRNLLLALIRGR